MNRKFVRRLSAFAGGAVLSLLLLAAFSLPAGTGSAAPAYSLREYRGKLAVFEQGKARPVRIIEMDVTLLPPPDQELLRAGIPAETEQELNLLLEDYTS